MKFGLKERELDEIKVLYYLFPEIDEIVIFGSRARGDYNKVSDIDIAIKGDVDKIMYKIRDYFEESSIIYTVDVVNYISISNQDFKENIDNEGIIVNS
ncbi:nucleotidyltransferase domain-containing protein [Cetobacterium somerae]|uniref:nucleotidyltransferase family protein n=1 Tax=Cetobacterium TaxID=180162 RepID=UPI001F069AB5|nr:nucleotidyltransferase domain-containing protein [Cetobacterium somerae]MCX3066769.1 nucleotidyltransferase domain-containing protein [Cetobacterium somerae]UPO98596.1 nucleotidyltransferase domain-containing protein [Cetobacterium somerae]